MKSIAPSLYTYRFIGLGKVARLVLYGPLPNIPHCSLTTESRPYFSSGVANHPPRPARDLNKVGRYHYLDVYSHIASSTSDLSLF